MRAPRMDLILEDSETTASTEPARRARILGVGRTQFIAQDPRGTRLAPHGSKWNSRIRGLVGQAFRPDVSPPDRRIFGLESLTYICAVS